MSEPQGTATTDEQPVWHAQPLDAVFAALETDASGLGTETAASRLAAAGPNEIRDDTAVSPLAIFVSQFQDALIYLLVLAAGLSLATGLLPGQEPAYVDAGLILLILLGNGVFGFVQDYRAEQSLERLRELSTPHATVVRGGAKQVVDATTLVPGDVVVLEAGDAVPADARLVEAGALATNEAPLTGESASVGKSTGAVDADTPLAERTNMVYMNTTVVAGRGLAVVVGTGMETEVGGIATQLQTAPDSETPFQREVDTLGRRIGLGVGALIALVIVVQLLLTEANVVAVLLTAITLAVAAVPEGLPAVVTLTLALGARRMVDRNALVRRLPVVESLGSVDVILTDKTGTLTESQMTVTCVATGSDTYAVTGSGLDPEGEFRPDGETGPRSDLDAVLRCGVVCNNAERVDGKVGGNADEQTGEEAGREADEYVGDPTEVALLVSALKAGITADGERVGEVPFSSERQRMTVVVREGAGEVAYTKGAPEVVLDRCETVVVDGDVRELTDDHRRALLDTVDDFAGNALRVLGFASKSPVDPDANPDEIETGLTFLGLQGMIDPPREEVPGAVADCRRAGIRVVMATGDNVETAKAIGERIGFDPSGATTGSELAELSDEALRDRVESVEIFARVSPEQKVRVLQALQANGHTVAMTGDGVNDAPGVRTADVGIAMGTRGTDVTRDASDMVLRDDNFATIRDAVAEGRGIFDNIRSFVTFLLSANAGEVLTVFVGVLVGSLLFPRLFAAQSEALILTPVMLLWINLVTDGPPALALGVDPTADDVLERDPRDAGDGVIDRGVAVSILGIGVSLAAVGVVLFFESLSTFGSLARAQTVLFTFFVLSEMGLVQVIRRRFGQSFGSNPWLLGAVATSLALHALVLYTPLSGLFGVVVPTGADWIRIGAGVGVVLAVNLLLSGRTR
jgi:Ca2+-transporting ATPase